ncbi:helix-turn-helix transcriptional regulator [Sphingomonas aquatilis]
MSKSTIYRRMDQGRFPRSLPIDGNIAAWREGDVAAWLSNPR